MKPLGSVKRKKVGDSVCWRRYTSQWEAVTSRAPRMVVLGHWSAPAQWSLPALGRDSTAKPNWSRGVGMAR